MDGISEDWQEQGFRVEFLTDPNGQSLPADDFDVRFRLGWHTEGLLVLVIVRDDTPLENKDLSKLWNKDCVELFATDKPDGVNRYQVALASGADPEFKTLRSRIYDWRLPDKKQTELTVNAASRTSQGQSVIEILLPWEYLDIVPDL